MPRTYLGPLFLLQSILAARSKMVLLVNVHKARLLTKTIRSHSPEVAFALEKWPKVCSKYCGQPVYNLCVAVGKLYAILCTTFSLSTSWVQLVSLYTVCTNTVPTLMLVSEAQITPVKLFLSTLSTWSTKTTTNYIKE